MHTGVLQQKAHEKTHHSAGCFCFTLTFLPGHSYAPKWKNAKFKKQPVVPVKTLAFDVKAIKKKRLFIDNFS
jgi:3-hydroxymyristoyl/3-hydroxydecanoyl-(acyl carrier protein) dehydratase